MANATISNIDNVLATIVLFNTSLEQSETFVSLTDSLKGLNGKMALMVYDNSALSSYRDGINEQWDIHYFHDPKNPGVSKAYNVGLKLAKKLKKEWLLLLDQDTHFPKNALADYISSISSHNSGLVAPQLISNNKIISPFKPTSGKGKVLQTIDPGKYSFNEMTPVNSGLMINVRDFEKAGGYDENFPLDYSDFAFLSRFKKIQDDFIVLPTTCSHQFSGFSRSDKTSTLNRFKLFCQSTTKYKRLVDSKTNICKILFARALNLSWQYKTLTFLKTAFLALWKRS